MFALAQRHLFPAESLQELLARVGLLTKEQADARQKTLDLLATAGQKIGLLNHQPRLPKSRTLSIRNPGVSEEIFA